MEEFLGGLHGVSTGTASNRCMHILKLAMEELDDVMEFMNNYWDSYHASHMSCGLITITSERLRLLTSYLQHFILHPF